MTANRAPFWMLEHFLFPGLEPGGAVTDQNMDAAAHTSEPAKTLGVKTRQLERKFHNTDGQSVLGGVPSCPVQCLTENP